MTWVSNRLLSAKHSLISKRMQGTLFDVERTKYLKAHVQEKPNTDSVCYCNADRKAFWETPQTSRGACSEPSGCIATS